MASPIYGTAFLNIQPDLNNFGTAMRAGVLGGGAGGLLGSIGKNAGLLLGGGLLLGVGAVIGGGKLLADIGDTFDSAFDQIRIGTGATGEELAGLRDDFKDVFQSVPTDADSAATAITDLNARLGLTGGDLSELAEQFLDLSRITETDLAGNIESVTRVFGDWGISIDDQTERLDQLFRASQVSGVEVGQLAGTLVTFGAPFRQLGFSFDEATALIAKFESEGVNTELVLGSMRIALGKLARAGEPAQETFERIVSAIENVGTVSEANALALELFGARAGPDMAAAIREGRFDIRDLFDTIANGEDTIATAAEDTNDWRESLNILKNRVLVALEPLARRVFEGIGNAVEAATPHIEAFVNWFSEKAVPAIEAFWGKVQPIFAGLGTLVSGAFGFVGDLFSIFDEPVDTSSLSDGEAALQGLNEQAELLPGSINPATTAVQGFVDTVAEVTGEVFSTVATSVEEASVDIDRATGNMADTTAESVEVAEGASSTFGEIVEKVGSDIATAWGEVGDEIVGVGAFGLEGIVEVGATSLRLLQGQFEIVMGLISFDWGRVWNGMGLIVDTAWAAITSIVERSIEQILIVVGAFVPDIRDRFFAGLRALQTGIRDMAKSVEDFFRGLPGRIIGWFTGADTLLKDAGSKIVQSLITGATSMFDRVKSVFNRLSDLIPSWKGPASTDAKLLTPAGELIMEGLIEGLESMFPQVRSVLGQLSDEISGTTFDPIDIPVLGADDGRVLDNVRRATARVSFAESDTSSRGVSIANFSVNNPIGEPTEESVQSALLEVAISPIVNRLISAGSSQ